MRAPPVVMRLPEGITSEPLSEPGCDEFFRYLNDHRADNGKAGTGYFAPLPQSESRFAPEKEPFFRAGLKLPVGTLGWRRAWVAFGAGDQIVGHVDLWSHSMRFADHRALLGMGVGRSHRRRGLGRALLAHAIQWATARTALEWLDLHVLSTNEAAIRLYLRAGFRKVGEVPGMFKFDDREFCDMMMALRLCGECHESS